MLSRKAHEAKQSAVNIEDNFSIFSGGGVREYTIYFWESEFYSYFWFAERLANYFCLNILLVEGSLLGCLFWNFYWNFKPCSGINIFAEMETLEPDFPD